MKQDYETYYAGLRRRAVQQLEARRKACEALDPGFAALQAKRGRVFSLPAQGAKLTLSTMRLEEEALLKRYDLPKDYLQPVYACPLCKDTGYVGEPVKRKCACRLKLEQRDMAENARINERETFERNVTARLDSSPLDLRVTCLWGRNSQHNFRYENPTLIR